VSRVHMSSESIDRWPPLSYKEISFLLPVVGRGARDVAPGECPSSAVEARRVTLICPEQMSPSQRREPGWLR
jgi:hypothetical protein